MQTIDITPSRDGFRMIRRAMAESVEAHTTTLGEIEMLRARLPELDFTLQHLSERERDLLDDALGLLTAARRSDIDALNASIAEIDAYLGAN